VDHQRYTHLPRGSNPASSDDERNKELDETDDFKLAEETANAEADEENRRKKEEEENVLKLKKEEEKKAEKKAIAQLNKANVNKKTELSAVVPLAASNLQNANAGGKKKKQADERQGRLKQRAAAAELKAVARPKKANTARQAQENTPKNTRKRKSREQLDGVLGNMQVSTEYMVNGVWARGN
jgi:hypothetical protein